MSIFKNNVLHEKGTTGRCSNARPCCSSIACERVFCCGRDSMHVLPNLRLTHMHSIIRRLPSSHRDDRQGWSHDHRRVSPERRRQEGQSQSSAGRVLRHVTHQRYTQVTRKIKRTLVKSKVNHVVAERMGWEKSVLVAPTCRALADYFRFNRFGAEKGKKAGADTATTVIGENIRVKLSAGGIKVRS